MNAVEIEEAISLLAEQPFVPAEFPFSFLEAFGNKETTIKRLKTGNNNRSNIDGGVLQQNNIHIAVCDEGKVYETLQVLKISPATSKGKVKFILATDGKEFQAEDVNSGETVSCDYPSFHNYFGFFLPLAGITTVKQIRENAFDIKATSRLNKLYIELLLHNPEWATSERRHDMNHFLARLIFCFFAEDTDIFEGNGLFTNTVQQMSAGDSSDTDEIISEIFRAMDTKPKERTERNIRNWATKFPYVNGQLFSGSTETPRFTRIARSYLLHVGNLDWKKINPDIFGSMIQAVADEDERGELGMHYTSVPNILKVLNPLFLDELRAQLEDAGNNARKLLNLRKRIARIRIFDPACGSGNFLVIAYKQLREIEYQINQRRGDINLPTEIPLTNFRGIELRHFSSEIARLALIIAEYQCDVLYRGQKLALAEFLPLNAENWITCGNALQIEWLSVCPPTGTGVRIYSQDLFSTPLKQAEIDFENEGGETYICGNPPYVWTNDQTPEQKNDLKELFSPHTSSWRVLNYVSGWFLKYVQYSSSVNCKGSFVTINTICQGQHAAIFWPIMYKYNYRISFAHEPFKWQNLASNNAGVTVVIIGLARESHQKAKFFSEDENKETVVRLVDCIGPYLTANIDTIVSKQPKSISGLAEMVRGNMPYEGGHLLLSKNEKDGFIMKDIDSERFILRISGSSEIIEGKAKYCIWIDDEGLNDAKEIPQIKERLAAVRDLRLKNSDKSVIALAKTPHKFRETNRARRWTIAMPAVSSETRKYLPADLLTKNHIISNRAYGLYDAPLHHFALLVSTMHITWIGTVCGKLEMRYSYSNTLGWNTFPLPVLTAKNKDDLTVCAEEILIARERHFPKTIADLYDPENMPADLQRAHDRNDEVLERIYIGRRFKNDTERIEKLFELYTQIISKRKTL
jgi:hypothetical protein